MKWERVAVPQIKTAFFTTKVFYWVTGLTSGIIILSLSFLISNNMKTPASVESDISHSLTSDSIMKPPVPNNQEVRRITDSIKNNIKKAKRIKEPVVIKRTIVHRQK